MAENIDNCQHCGALYLHTRIGLCDECMSYVNHNTPPSPPTEITLFTSPVSSSSSMFSSMTEYNRTRTTVDYMNVGGEDDSTHIVWSKNLETPKFEKDPTIIPVNNRSHPIGRFLKKNNIEQID